MKAMILAAGYGTRLRPLTYLLPKPVFPVCNKPLIAYAVDSILAAGAKSIVVNLHHLPDAIEETLIDLYDCEFHFSLEHEILGTGGGIRHVDRLLRGDDEFLLANGDTIQFPPWEALISARRATDAIAALTLRHPPAGDRFTPVFFDGGRVTGFGSGTGEQLMFSGSHAISPRVFDLMPDSGEFSIVDAVYRDQVAAGAVAAIVDDGAWFDVGTPQRYLAANAALRGDASVVGHPSAIVSGFAERSVVGANSVVAGKVTDTVIWEDCHIGAGVTLANCIVGHDVDLRRNMTIENAIICRDALAIPRTTASYEFTGGIVIARF